MPSVQDLVKAVEGDIILDHFKAAALYKLL